MSAAAPLPPPHPTDGGGAGGYGNGRRPSATGPNGGERAYAHIQDLREMALRGWDRNSSVHRLLDDADRALKQAQTLLDMRRPDLSYVEYMRASEIVVETIPHGKEWADLHLDHGGGGMHKYQLLQKKINGLAEQYANVKDIIVNNNKRSGAQPQSAGGGGHGRSDTALQVNGHAHDPHRARPTPSPKPDRLHGRAVSAASAAPPNSSNTDVLADRFARLRMIDTPRPDSRASTQSSVQSSPISMPNAEDFGSRTSLDSLSRTTSGRPQGPRGMPNGNAGPPLPGKLPLDTTLAAAMPKAPEATYSPARNMQTTGNIAPPRHSARSLASNPGRRTSLVPSSSASSTAPNGNYAGEHADYFPAVTPSTSHGSHPGQMTRRKSVLAPKETRVGAQRLYDYLERFNILVIDFRSREDFDQGHIFTRNAICIDPLSVTPGMSADQLSERLVISPENEQEMFMNRDKFDLVVYYDAHTQSETYLTRPANEPQLKLKHLHEALYDFNQDKPLQRPPILLAGGLDAWVDLVGNQALLSTDTAARMKQGRPPSRRPAGSSGSQIRIPKKGLRDYNPLDADELKMWNERIRVESVSKPTGITDENGELVEEPSGDEDSGDAIKEFLERFPDAGSLDRYAFGPLQPKQPPPEPPAKIPIPSYPATPTPSNYTSEPPARPQPAAPRMSYKGVDERAVSQNAPPQRSSSLAPYVPTRYLAANLRLPRTGLVNPDIWCYMNATLQALSATTSMSIFFLEDRFRGYLQRENWKGSKGVLPELYANVIRSLWKGDVNAIKASTFRTFCGRLKKQWNDGCQQDAQEFLNFLIDGLHEDLNVNWAKTPLRVLTDAEEARRERMPKPVVVKMEWERYTHRDQSFINGLFSGQTLSRLRCPVCGTTSTTYEAFYSLSVEIPRERRDSRGHFPTLDECMRSFCKEELLGPGEMYKCKTCNEERQAYKQITVTRAPQFLIVCLKRMNNRMEKVSVPVDFPLDGFDLEPYMIPAPSAVDAAAIARDYGPDAVAPGDPATTPPYVYDAYGIVRHMGPNMWSGHYIALVKDRARGLWREFNDSRVTDFVPGQGRWAWDGPNDVRNGNAYILFYQRRMQGPPTPQQGPIGPGGVGKI